MMFAENQRISRRQLRRQTALSLIGVLLLFQAGDMASGGGNSIVGMLLGLGALLLYVCFLVRASAVYSNLERYFGCIGKWLITLVYLSFLVLSGSVLLERISLVTGRYLLSGVPLPLISAVFLAAACIGAGHEIQRRGRLAELLFPWVLVLLVLLLIFAAFHFHRPDFTRMAPWSLEAVSAGAYEYFAIGTSISLAAFLLGAVERGDRCRAGSSFRSLAGSLLQVTAVLLAVTVVLLGVYGFRGVASLEFPILELMAGTGLPGGFLKRFDIVWLGILVFSLLFSLGSLLFYGSWLTGGNGRKRDWGRLVMAALIWLGSLAGWSGQTISNLYTTVLRDIYGPLFLLITLLALWAQKRMRREREETGCEKTE